MGLSTKALGRLTARIATPGSFEAATLAGAHALTLTSGQFQVLDPDGSHRDVTLPTVAAHDSGYFVLIANSAGGAENLVVKDAGASTIGTVNQSEAGLFYVSAAGAWLLFGVFTFAAS
jgi:hypothetical protein